MTEPSDEELLIRSSSDAAVFTRFYRRHAEELLRFVVNRTFDPEVAADLTAETFAQAFASRGRFRSQGEGSASAWLYTIARRQIWRFRRRGRVEDHARRRLGIDPGGLTEADFERIEDLVDFEQLGRAVASAFRRLSAEQQEALTLRVIEGRPYEEIARELNCSEQAARARVSRGLRTLAAALEV